MPPKSIFRGGNGLPLEIDEGRRARARSEQAGMIFVDGVDIGRHRGRRAARPPDALGRRDLHRGGDRLRAGRPLGRLARDHLPRRPVRRRAGRLRRRDPRRRRGVAGEVGRGRGARDLPAPVPPARRRGRVRLQAPASAGRWSCRWSSRSERTDAAAACSHAAATPIRSRYAREVRAEPVVRVSMSCSPSMSTFGTSRLEPARQPPGAVARAAPSRPGTSVMRTTNASASTPNASDRPIDLIDRVGVEDEAAEDADHDHRRRDHHAAALAVAGDDRLARRCRSGRSARACATRGTPRSPSPARTGSRSAAPAGS